MWASQSGAFVMLLGPERAELDSPGQRPGRRERQTLFSPERASQTQPVTPFQGFRAPRVAGSQGVALGCRVVTLRAARHETHPERTKPVVKPKFSSPRPSPPQWSPLRKPHRVWGRGGRTLENALWKSFTALPEGVVHRVRLLARLRIGPNAPASEASLPMIL